MAASEYEVGQRVRLSAAFSVDGSAVDPTLATFRVKTPSGAVSSLPVTRDGVGAYHADVDVTEAGTWYWRAEGTGAAQAAGESAFVGKHSEFA